MRGLHACALCACTQVNWSQLTFGQKHSFQKEHNIICTIYVCVVTSKLCLWYYDFRNSSFNMTLYCHYTPILYLTYLYWLYYDFAHFFYTIIHRFSFYLYMIKIRTNRWDPDWIWKHNHSRTIGKQQKRLFSLDFQTFTKYCYVMIDLYLIYNTAIKCLAKKKKQKKNESIK